MLEGIRQIVSAGTKVTYVKGCDVTGTRLDEIDRAREAAAHADVAIVVVGESSAWGRGQATDRRRGTRRRDAGIDGLQEELVKAVQAAGKPTVVVLINGRPLAVRWIAAACARDRRGLAARRKGGQGRGRGPLRRRQSQRQAVGHGSPPRRPTAGLLQYEEVETLLAASTAGGTPTWTWSRRRSIISATG